MTARALRWAAIAAIAVVLVWAFAARMGLFGEPEKRPIGLHSRVAPFRLPVAQEPGATLALDDLRGKGVLLSFTATWCEPCLAELPLLEKLHERYAGLHFAVVGVSDEPEETVQRFLLLRPVQHPILTDRTGRLRARFGADALPYTVFVGPDGRVAGKHAGILREAQAAAAVEHLIVESRSYQRAGALRDRTSH